MNKKSIGYLLSTAMMFGGCARPDSCCDDVVEQRYVHKYGMDVPKNHWEEIGQNGQVVTVLKEGVTCTQNFYDGLLEGETSYTFPNSRDIEKVEVYSQNILSKETDYYPSGHPKRQITHDSPNTFIVKQWYENGAISLSETFVDDALSSGEYFDTKHQRSSSVDTGSGVRTQRDGYGRLVATESIRNGGVESRTIYYPTGSPKEVIPYKNDLVDGLKKTFLPGGEPVAVETWKDGKQEGITTLFHEGLKQEEIPYVNGARNGIGKVYKEGTVVVQEVSWKDDLRHGPTVVYSGNDRSSTTEWYYKGSKVSKGYYDSFTVPTGVAPVSKG